MSSCPVTFSYLSTVLSSGRFNETMHEPIIIQLHSLQERAKGDDPILQKLRAFYCIETMISRMATALLMGAGCTPEALALGQFEPPRSWEGLGQVIDKCEELEGDVMGASLELGFEMKYSLGSTQGNQIFRAGSKPASQLFNLCVSAAEHLRPQLRTFKNLGKVGQLFAKACPIARTSNMDYVEHASTLLSITERNAVRGWD